MTELLQKQIQFSRMVGQLLCFAAAHGINATIGEAWRTPEMADIYASRGNGIRKSLHCLRLAIDINIYDASGKPQMAKEVYAPMGEYWESLGGAWGGRFRTLVDPFHFSLEHEGRK